MNIDYRTLEDDLVSGVFRTQLQAELEEGFRPLKSGGERLPAASHYASQIAEIVSRGAANPFDPELAFNVYQEILAAVEAARATVLGED
ncbi:MAG: hypothetical protein ACXW2F_12675 [Thermoanaerobaculia bacterium]